MDYAVINLAGHVVADPAAKQGKDGKEFATFSIAVNQRHGGQDITSYYDCVVPGFMFQTMQKANVGKGSALSITGKQTIRTYQTREGHPGTSVNINVLDWRFEGSRPKNEAQPNNAPHPAQQAGGQYTAPYPAQQNGGQYVPQQYAGNNAPQPNQQNGYGYGNVQPPVNLQDADDLPV